MKHLKLFFALFAMLALGVGNAWAAEETLVYTLDGTQTGGSQDYATESDITQGGISWKVTGNTTMNPWRIGGKKITAVDRTVYNTTAIPDNISKITIEHGTAASITVNSFTLIVASDASFSSVVSTLTGTFAASNTITFERPDGHDWTNRYYKLIYNLTYTPNSNKYVQFINAKFYSEESTSEPDPDPTPDPEEPETPGTGGSGTIVIKYNSTFAPALPTTKDGANATSTEHTVENLTIKEQGLYNNGSGYIMFVQGKGFLYNTQSLGTITSVSVTYTGGTSTAGEAGVYFGSTEQSTYTTSSNQTIKGQSKTDTWTNTTEGNGFFQLSTSNKNVQITQIEITYTSGSEGGGSEEPAV